MKLHYVQTLFIALILLVVTSIWGALFYWHVLDKVQDSLDDGLENTAEQLSQAWKSDSIPETVTQWGAKNYIILPVSFAITDEPIAKDTLMYHVKKGENEPMRLLTMYIQHEGKQWYMLKVARSTVEKDKLIKVLGWGLLWFYIGTLAVFTALYLLLSSFLWKPFYQTLQFLRNFNLTQKQTLKSTTTSIHEFKTLQTEVEQLTQRVHQQFNTQKQFIENVAHELQTPLAIALSKADQLIRSNEVTEAQSGALASIHSTLHRLGKLNQSLLLLSKIENKQFVHAEPTSITAITDALLSDFEDITLFKELQIQWSPLAPFVPTIHPELAHILVSNLLKNAITHAPKQSVIRIKCTNTYWFIENESDGSPLDDRCIFNRFWTQSKKAQSTGLGLAIAQSIVQQFDLLLYYSFVQNRHRFTIKK